MNKNIMSQEIYELLYVHYDRTGRSILDVDDVIYCNDDEIPVGKIEKLESLLVPYINVESGFISVESARLLAAWGSKRAIDYLEYCIDIRIDKMGEVYPHRLHNYDTIYEKMIVSFLNYYARLAEKDFEKTSQPQWGEIARERIKSPLKKIVILSGEVNVDLGFLIRVVKKHHWEEYLPEFKRVYFTLSKLPEESSKRQWNLPKLKELLVDLDPNFIDDVE